jgi:hypothetical protein
MFGMPSSDDDDLMNTSTEDDFDDDEPIAAIVPVKRRPWPLGSKKKRKEDEEEKTTTTEKKRTGEDAGWSQSSNAGFSKSAIDNKWTANAAFHEIVKQDAASEEASSSSARPGNRFANVVLQKARLAARAKRRQQSGGSPKLSLKNRMKRAARDVQLSGISQQDLLYRSSKLPAALRRFCSSSETQTLVVASLNPKHLHALVEQLLVAPKPANFDHNNSESKNRATTKLRAICLDGSAASIRSDGHAAAVCTLLKAIQHCGFVTRLDVTGVAANGAVLRAVCNMLIDTEQCALAQLKCRLVFSDESCASSHSAASVLFAALRQSAPSVPTKL